MVMCIFDAQMNRTLYKDSHNNAIRISEFRKIESDVAFAGVGIKYVVAGQETYHANGKRYLVKTGEYIVGNDFTSSHVQIDYPQLVHGLCIDISSEIVAEVAQYHDSKDSDIREFLLSDQFFVNRYHVNHTQVGKALNRRLDHVYQALGEGNNPNNIISTELFYDLAESIVLDQRWIFDHLRRLDFKKTETNEELLRALLKARECMDDQLLQNLALDHICKHAGISKYHFIRLFKSTFGVSPHKYQKLRRLEYGRQQIENGKCIAETAFILGYADVPSFSKAFKLAFGHAPGFFKK